MRTVLIASDPAVVAAVEAAGIATDVYARAGLAARAGVIGHGETVLIDHAAAVTLAALEGFDDAHVIYIAAGDIPAATFTFAEMAGIEHVISLPIGAEWLAQHVVAAA